MGVRFLVHSVVSLRTALSHRLPGNFQFKFSH